MKLLFTCLVLFFTINLGYSNCPDYEPNVGESSTTLMNPIVSSTIPTDFNLCPYIVGVLDQYIDGTQSGSNWVYLSVGGNFPIGTTYTWWITRQNGSTQFYAASTAQTRQVAASINNRVTKARVVANYQNCSQTTTKTFRCAIPNTDINGNLFPECGPRLGLGGGGGFGFFRAGATSQEITVFPNPTKSEIQFKGENLDQLSISILDLSGNLLVRNANLSDKINIEKLNAGIYLYTITDENGFIQRGKIVKE